MMKLWKEFEKIHTEAASGLGAAKFGPTPRAFNLCPHEFILFGGTFYLDWTGLVGADAATAFGVSGLAVGKAADDMTLAHFRALLFTQPLDGAANSNEFIFTVGTNAAGRIPFKVTLGTPSGNGQPQFLTRWLGIRLQKTAGLTPTAGTVAVYADLYTDA